MLSTKIRRLKFLLLALVFSCVVVALGVAKQNASADAPLPPDPQSSSVGVEGTLGAKPPTQAGSIATPSNGQVLTTNPVTVSGLCPKGLLVKVFSNNVFVGSVQCTNGSFSLSVDLFNGQNDIVVRVYDALDQAGPDSNTVAVTLNNAQFAQFGSELTLTSTYAKRGANPGQELDWPIILSGGTGPYAISVDWGDGKPAELLSASFAGEITVHHTYNTSGIFVVTVRVTDKDGQAAFLQLVGVSNGPIAQSTSANGTNQTTLIKTEIIWWPAALLLPLLGAAFWLGRRNELFNLRRQLERSNERQQ